MNILARIDQLHLRVRNNKWFRYFAIFNRIALAAGFLPSGMQKVLGERFTVLAVNHPMGHYLDALYQTGFYYTSIGIFQVLAAILLLIPRTATLGAVIYFPLILNICILTFAVRFDGSLITSPLMVLANLYLLCWDYHKFKFILPFNVPTEHNAISEQKGPGNKFPKIFFGGVVATILIVLLVNTNIYNIRPHNTLPDCRKQCEDSKNPEACYEFCNCIHEEGRPLNECLDEYKKSLEGSSRTP